MKLQFSELGLSISHHDFRISGQTPSTVLVKFLGKVIFPYKDGSELGRLFRLYSHSFAGGQSHL